MKRAQLFKTVVICVLLMLSVSCEPTSTATPTTPPTPVPPTPIPPTPTFIPLPTCGPEDINEPALISPGAGPTETLRPEFLWEMPTFVTDPTAHCVPDTLAIRIQELDWVVTAITPHPPPLMDITIPLADPSVTSYIPDFDLTPASKYKWSLITTTDVAGTTVTYETSPARIFLTGPVCAAPASPPSLYMPVGGATVDGYMASSERWLNFVWIYTADICLPNGYHVQLSDISDFSTTIEDFDTTPYAARGMIYPTSSLVECQEYFWRVASIVDGVEYPFSATESFTYSPTLLCLPEFPFKYRGMFCLEEDWLGITIEIFDEVSEVNLPTEEPFPLSSYSYHLGKNNLGCEVLTDYPNMLYCTSPPQEPGFGNLTILDGTDFSIAYETDLSIIDCDIPEEVPTKDPDDDDDKVTCDPWSNRAQCLAAGGTWIPDGIFTHMPPPPWCACP